MVQIVVDGEFGYVALLVVAFYLLQALILVIPVIRQRIATKIKAPTLYPRDSEIKDLKLSPEQVDAYMCAQRAHQNSVEFSSVFLALFLVAGLYAPRHASIAGVVVWIGRLFAGLGYTFGAKHREYGGFWHLGEFYIIYLAIRFGYELLTAQTNNA